MAIFTLGPKTGSTGGLPSSQRSREKVMQSRLGSQEKAQRSESKARISWTNKNRVMCATNDRGGESLEGQLCSGRTPSTSVRCALGAHHHPPVQCEMSPGITFGQAFVNIFLQYWSPWDLKLDAKKTFDNFKTCPTACGKEAEILTFEAFMGASEQQKNYLSNDNLILGFHKRSIYFIFYEIGVETMK